jgi:hypothetical protein
MRLNNQMIEGILSYITGVIHSIYHAFQVKKQREYEQLPFVTCRILNSSFMVEGVVGELKVCFSSMNPLMIKFRNMGKGPAIRIQFKSGFWAGKIRGLLPREEYTLNLPSLEGNLKIDTEGEFNISYNDIYQNKKSVGYKYEIIPSVDQVIVEEKSRSL